MYYCYFLLYQGTNEVFKLWKVAYDVGREDATAVAKAQYEWTEETETGVCSSTL